MAAAEAVEAIAEAAGAGARIAASTASELAKQRRSRARPGCPLGPPISRYQRDQPECLAGSPAQRTRSSSSIYKQTKPVS